MLADLTSPLYVTHARDGSNRLFVVEQAGRIKVLPPGATTPTVFLDIASRVLAGGERGLLGLAFHPRFNENGRFFVDYTRRPDGATVIAEYRVSATNPDVAAPSELTLLVIEQPFPNHNGGMVEFGPDGFLYIGMGDGGSAFDPGNRAQDKTSLLGKILRIDIDRPESPSVPYSSPPGNPFAGPDPGRDEIFALGLRNPWRFSFDRATGQLYVADVGQNLFEEIDLVTVGGNYGWRVFEGTHCTNKDPERCGESGFVSPIAEYGHTGNRCSITGGYVYRGSASSLPNGAYVYGDFCSGEIFMLKDGVQTVLLDTELAVASFGEDEAGEIYVVNLAGTVHRIANPDAPVLTLSLNQTAFRAGGTLRVRFGARNGLAAMAASFYFGIILPDGRTVIFLTSPSPLAGVVTNVASDARTFPPLVADVVVPAGLDLTVEDFVVFTFARSEPPGTYRVFAALGRPGAFDDGRVDPGDLLAIAVQAFSVGP